MSQDSSFCSRCKNPVFKPRINVNTAELYTKLRSEFGTAVYRPQDVQEMLLLSDRDLENYESEIIRLKSQIFYVEAQKKRLQDYKVKLRSLMSPIRQLPNETLGRIFEFACNENLLQQYPWLDPDNPPPTALLSPLLRHLPTLAISAVCARWRSLTLSTPRLWSNLRLEILTQDSGPVMSNGCLSTLEYYLERSADWPLFINLTVAGHSQEAEHVLLTSLNQHAQRWKSFTFRGDFMISHHQIHFPILEELNIDLKGQKQSVSLGNLRCFQNAPKVRAFTTNTTPNALKHFDLALNKLTFMDIRSSRRGEMGDVLDICPDVVTLKLQQRSTKGGYSNLSVTPHIVLNKVSSLTLRFYRYEVDGDFLEAVFASYTLPALTELHIEATNPPWPRESIWPKLTFTEFMARSLCSITSFSIHRLGISDLDVISALQLLPSLLELSINDDFARENESPVTSRLVSHLHSSGLDDQSSSSSPLLPKLRSLKLNVGGNTFDDATFVNTVLSRWLPDPDYAEVVGVSCLRCVVLLFRDRKVDEKIYEPLNHLDKMGMQVVITGLE